MPNRFGLNRSLGGAVALIGVVALASSAVVFVETRAVHDAEQAQEHSRIILSDLDRFRAAMLNQESGVRGYLLTGRAESLAPYTLGLDQLGQAIGRLRALTAVEPDPAQARALDNAVTVARRWQAEVGQPIVADMARPGGRATAMAIEASGEGKAHFDAFRVALRAIEAPERRALEQQTARAADAQQRLVIAVAVGSLITLLICGLVAWTLNRLVARPLMELSEVMRRLVQRDMAVEVPSLGQRNEVGEMARAVEVFRASLIELDRTALLRVTADTLPAMVGYIDTERRIGFLNSEFARWFDLKVEDVSQLQGQSVEQAFPAHALPGAHDQLELALSGQEIRFEQTLARPDGLQGDVETYYRPHRAPDGRILGAVALLTDVTERKAIDRRLVRQAQDLMRSNEELEQFAYVASHDLKAPLRGIDNLVSWIEEDLEGVLVDDTRNNMVLLKSRVKRLENLLDDLLAYSRAGRDDLLAEAVDARILVEELATLISPPAGFVITAAPDLPTLNTARAALGQVLQNLLSNAIKHHDRPGEGRIEVSVRDEEPMLEFVVTDDGPGVPEQFRTRVFGMFQTLRPRDDVEGSGMGLAIVKKLVERQGGSVWLTDGRDGRGLVVHFTWPKVLRGRDHGTDG